MPTAADYAAEIEQIERVLNAGITSETVGTEKVTYDLARLEKRLRYLKGLTATTKPRRRFYGVDLSRANQ